MGFRRRVPVVRQWSIDGLVILSGAKDLLGGPGRCFAAAEHRRRRVLRVGLRGWLVLGLLLLSLTGCGEMYHQPSFQPQEPPRLAPPTAAVPVTGVERSYTGVEGKDLTNPIPRDQASVDRGRNLYNTNCAMCHGREGRGDGAVASAYIPRPADLTSSRVQSLTDGDLFLRITNGFSTMPPFRGLLAPDERWHIVNYARTLGPPGSSP